MKISIYQIDPDRDAKRLRFLNLEKTRQVLHAHEPEAFVPKRQLVRGHP